MLNKKSTQSIYKDLMERLTDRRFLKKIKMSKKAMLEILQREKWQEHISKVLKEDELRCNDILFICEKTLNALAETPEKGWLDYIYKYTVTELFPENPATEILPASEIGRLFYLEVLRTFLRHERLNKAHNPRLHMEILTEEEIASSGAGEEYKRLLRIFRDAYVYEFMRIGAEITRFNTLAHISGVHHIAMHVARQLLKAKVPVDLALVSGAAAGHDIGKYGCRPHEEKRVPYLHYYYTDLYFRKNDMPGIGHIATNHSTWDLELENLSVESLILIYADFRVKSVRLEDGSEEAVFYSLKDSFDVILSKLDNVDQAKKERYIRVYAKLKDFEDYMMGLGVNTDLSTREIHVQEKKDVSLMDSKEVVQTLKNLAIKHNIFLMNELNSETSFGDLLEAARSEKDWKNIRAYINILQEYFTYITQKQKILTLNFLYELLMHREGDIRRQAAYLLANIIVHYDEEYRKELPADAAQEYNGVTSRDLWKKYLESIILPDHKVTDQHKRWIGFTLKLIVGSVLTNCKEEDQRGYLEELLIYYADAYRDDSTAFILLDAMSKIPLSMCNREDIGTLIRFAGALSTRDTLEIQIAALRFIKYLSECGDCDNGSIQEISAILDGIPKDELISISFLKYKIRSNLGLEIKSREEYVKRLYQSPGAISEMFLENLKAATPWVIKSVNIELLLDQINEGYNGQVLQVATHFSNLVKVSERVAVRHRAGQALISIAPKMTLDQRNEIVIELTKGLEIGEYEFSKYIPAYLGQLALYLHPAELDEFIKDLRKLLESTNVRVASVTLNTLGILIQKYPAYKERFPEEDAVYKNRRETILGLLLKGLADYEDTISQEAFLVIGQYIFGSPSLKFEEKYEVFRLIYKKLLTLFSDQEESKLSFFNNAASLNHIYRFISDYIFLHGSFQIAEPEKAAFFPGTFDPFSLSHKGIVNEIKNLGFEVYLALDEFSWSKKTQPRMIRRKIINMSVANERDVYLFPDDIPVNIANPKDLQRLSQLFPTKEIYIVVGSDVIVNASSYKAEPQEHSIHHFNHVVFKRGGNAAEAESADYVVSVDGQCDCHANIIGKVIELTLPVYLEDISSTRIRENIDYNRDISNLIDPKAQNYIYDNSLYLREPQYKHILKAKAIKFEFIDRLGHALIQELSETLLKETQHLNQIKQYLRKAEVRAILVRDGEKDNELVGIATFHQLKMADLYQEFGNIEVTEYIRKHTSGKVIVLSGILSSAKTEIRGVEQLALTETLAHCLEEDFSYAIYHDYLGSANKSVTQVLQHQGFTALEDGTVQDPILLVNMEQPVSLFKNMETTLKEPFNRNGKVLKVLEEAHERLQEAITKLYPGSLVLSFNAGVMHYRLVDKITRENHVPNEPTPVKALGKFMCVPFGKILRGMAVPNTVTKALHTEKIFEAGIQGFSIKEFPFYSPLAHQIRTIKSFNRPVILVDDLLHKGYRMKELDPIFKQEDVNISKLIVGILSGRGKDLMTIQGRRVDSVYFMPNLRAWFVESSMYPFVGGDGVRRKSSINASIIPSVNLMLPYVAPNFLVDAPKEALYDFSMICLENARNILMVLEEEYQLCFERNLTLNRLGEAIISPRYPDVGDHMSYDLNLPPSVYISNDIEKLIRLRKVIL